MPISATGIVVGFVIISLFLIVAFVLAVVCYTKLTCSSGCGSGKGGKGGKKKCGSGKCISMLRSNITTQVIPNGGVTRVVFPTLDSTIGNVTYDTGVFTVQKRGLYLVSYALRVSPASMTFTLSGPPVAGSETQFWVAVNGVDGPRYANSQVGPVSAASGVQLTNGTTKLSLEVGDQVEVRAFPTGTAPITLDGTDPESNHVSIAYLCQANVPPPPPCPPCPPCPPTPPPFESDSSDSDDC